jgi:hypothetical protein
MMMQDEESDSAPVLQRKWIKDQMKKRCKMRCLFTSSLYIRHGQYCVCLEDATLHLRCTDLPPSFQICHVSGREIFVIPLFSLYFVVLGM